MKIIDLLNKIAKGEVKQNTNFRITWNGIYRDFYYDDKEPNELNCLKNISDDYPLQDEISLNDEVEIIEEDKKIEKIKEIGQWSEDVEINARNMFEIKQKINEIIDKINGE